MRLYQLKILNKGGDLILDPVFKSIDALNLFKQKYVGRKMEVIPYNFHGVGEYIYRIKDNGEILKELFDNYEDALQYITSEELKDCSIMKENIVDISSLNYSLIEI